MKDKTLFTNILQTNIATVIVFFKLCHCIVSFIVHGAQKLSTKQFNFVTFIYFSILRYSTEEGGHGKTFFLSFHI